MCGILGVLGQTDVTEPILDGLRRLEYRGYDSAGVATVDGAGKLDRRRAEGKLRNLERVVMESPLAGHSGIGHTRWATHGAPTETNAHPHATDKVMLVHNGIIENYKAIKDELAAQGFVFATDTDSEVIAHLITHYVNKGDDPKTAFSTALRRLEGAFALAVLFAGEQDLLMAARRGSPIAVGRNDQGVYLGSDAYALSPFTNRVTYLDEGDWAVLRRSGIQIFDANGDPAERPEKVVDLGAVTVDKGQHRHFMAKEIWEQPEVVAHTLSAYIDPPSGATRELSETIDFANTSRLFISACGTAYYAGSIARYWFETLARLPVDGDIASEYRYRDIPLANDAAAVFISQSGETADTLAALRHTKQQQVATAALVNVPESSIAREADVVYRTMAGPEIGVASTKAFSCQLAALAALAIRAGRARGVFDAKREQELVETLLETPRLISEALQREGEIETFAHEIAKARDVLYIGRSVSYPLAMEGALKLKEISYIHAEGYAAGELKHGPIALVDEHTPIIVIAPMDDLFEKTISNMQEVIARGGKALLITDERGASAAGTEAWSTIVAPEVDPVFSPLVYAVPIQLLAYYTAVAKGTDVDQPRNLAKSVTVE